jgi:hypothetical protein
MLCPVLLSSAVGIDEKIRVQEKFEAERKGLEGIRKHSIRKRA